MSNKSLFRKEAQDWSFSPERLDERIQLLPLYMWVALFALVLVLFIGTVWGFFGHIDTKVAGSGILMKMGGFDNVVAPSAGTIMYLNITEGDDVEQGQVVGAIEKPLLLLEIKQLSQKLEIIQRWQNELMELEDTGIELQKDYFDKMDGNTRNTLGKLSQSEDYLRELSDLYAKMQEKAIVSKVSYYDMLRNLLEAEINVMRKQAEDFQMMLKKFEFTSTRRKELMNAQREFELVLNELEMKKNQLITEGLLVSQFSGRVISICKKPGDHVMAGETVLTLQTAFFDTLEVTAFIPVQKGKMVRAGQLVYIAPTTVEAQRFGYMLGLVRRVDDFPASSATIEAVVKNRDLVETFRAGGTQLQVVVDLIPEQDNETGYMWTCSPPRDAHITAGTLCMISVTVESRPPASYVVPWLREKMLGIGAEEQPKVGTAAKKQPR